MHTDSKKYPQTKKIHLNLLFTIVGTSNFRCFVNVLCDWFTEHLHQAEPIRTKIYNLGVVEILGPIRSQSHSSPKFQEDQNELGIATAEDAQRTFGRNVRSKIR